MVRGRTVPWNIFKFQGEFLNHSDVLTLSAQFSTGESLP